MTSAPPSYVPCVALLVALMLAGGTRAETVLHVSPDGRDTWSGGLAVPSGDGDDGPLASLEGARDAIRRLKASGPLAEPVRVLVAAGEYRLARPVVFSPEDSGTAECPVIYEAAPGANPVFTGGVRITGFRQGPGGVWQATVDDVARGGWYFEQLFVNGRWATRARSPNQFYYYMVGKVARGIDPATGQLADLGSRAFRARPGDVKPWPNINDVVLVAYHSWETSQHRLAAVDPETNTVICTGPAAWGFMQWGPTQRYHVENFREALDQPGEWYLDRDGTLSYIPLEGETPEAAEVYAPVTEQFVQFVGETALGVPVEHITLRGLAFRHAAYTLPPQGHSDGQAASSMPAVIMADGARSITIDQCEVGYVGIHGVWFRRGCRDCTVQRSYIHDTGAGFVRIGEGVIQPNEADRTSHIVVDNNVMHIGGRIDAGCVGIWIGQSGDNQVTHNDISDLFYTGISVGWTWGYGPSLASNNTIDFNHIHHIGWGVLSDMGGVYTLGISPGTTVSNNVIHHVYSYDQYGRGGWGLYNDEGSSDMVLENNLVYRVKTGTYHQHYGQGNVVRNNILCYSMDGQIQRSRVEEHLSFTYQNNLVVWNGGDLAVAGSLRDANVQLDSNLYWNEAGPVTVHGMSFEEYQATGHDQNSLVADPLFVDPAHDDYHLQPGSPAEQTGFKPFDYSQAGVYGDGGWVALPTSFTYAEVEFAPPPPPPPPLAIDDGFELSAIGDRPTDAQCFVEGKGDSIGVVDTDPAAGQHCLMVQDAPGLEHNYNPHFLYTPGHISGVSTFGFDIKVGDGVTMYVEWRDASAPYKVGPSVWITNGRLTACGRDLMTIPADQWTRVEITAGLGPQSTGTWRLSVQSGDEPAQEFTDLPFGSADFAELRWLGFSSSADAPVAFYLDNLRLTSTAQ